MIRTEEFVDTLRGHAFLRDFTPGHTEILARIGLELEFDQEEIIFRLGEASSYFYLIAAGSVALEMEEGGTLLRVDTLREGEELGWSSVLERTNKQFLARALSNVRVYAFEGARLRRACDEDPSFGYALMKRLLEVVTTRLEAMRAASANDRDRVSADWLCEP